MGKNPHGFLQHYHIHLIIYVEDMNFEVKKRELYDTGMAILAVAVVLVLLLNLFILFELF
ncbi:hypothetical protein FK178_13795 [Antarcticibacterium arcticum]|uniref:Uncharacterized protein n=1 Tax=Antarcticibacterium arcticum TaxID=2585771 RepID=A0A5B8YMI6_9FLAO|nr:hypothetical protein [Antarcticibacterium arcticum]QED38721.1 hypothetical protein FK178_13795 [Antarcticibacterium arcticum]